MDRLGRYDAFPTTNDAVFQACDYLIDRYPNDWKLLHQRGLAHVRKQQIELAQVDFKKAFEICPSVLLADWLAMTSYLVGRQEDVSLAQARLAEILQEEPPQDDWLRRDLIQAYCLYGNAKDYTSAIELIDQVVAANNNASLSLTQSLAHFRGGSETAIVQASNDGNPRDVTLYLCFEALRLAQAGDRSAAREQLREARRYIDTILTTPDGPDFQYVERTKDWIVAQVAVRQVEEALSVEPQATVSTE